MKIFIFFMSFLLMLKLPACLDVLPVDAQIARMFWCPSCWCSNCQNVLMSFLLMLKLQNVLMSLLMLKLPECPDVFPVDARIERMSWCLSCWCSNCQHVLMSFLLMLKLPECPGVFPVDARIERMSWCSSCWSQLVRMQEIVMRCR